MLLNFKYIINNEELLTYLKYAQQESVVAAFLRRHDDVNLRLACLAVGSHRSPALVDIIHLGCLAP